MAAIKHISLSKLQTLIKRRLEEAMPLACWVTAEIGELKVNYSGHCYLELVEKGGDNGVPCAKAAAVIWRSQYGMISSYFRSETGGDLAAGMNVLVKVTVSYHELYGLTLVISDIDPLYTLGDIERQRQKTIARLRQEGVFDMNRSIPLPAIPQRVAVVSSRNAAGYQDFMNELKASPFAFRTELFDAFMQGHAAEESVIEALGRVCERLEEFDLVVVIRGGGAQSDLAVFDSYRLCCHIAQFPLPVVTGIGHDKDESIADMVAAAALKTPTAVAGFLVDSMQAVDSWLESAQGELLGIAVGIVEDGHRNLREAAYRLSTAASNLSKGAQMQLERLASAIEGGACSRLAGQCRQMDIFDKELRSQSRTVLLTARRLVEGYGRLVESRDPRKILSLGFAVVRSGGRAVSDSGDIKAGDLLEITLNRGSLTARTENVKEK